MVDTAPTGGFTGSWADFQWRPKLNYQFLYFLNCIVDLYIIVIKIKRTLRDLRLTIEILYVNLQLDTFTDY